MKKFHVLIKAMVQDANAFQGYTLGMPTPITAISFAEYLKLEILKTLKGTVSETPFSNHLSSYNPDYPSNSFDYMKVEDVYYGFDSLSFNLQEDHSRFINYQQGVSKEKNATIVDLRKFSSKFFVGFTINVSNDLRKVKTDLYKNIILHILNYASFSSGKIFNVREDNIYIESLDEMNNREADDKKGLPLLFKEKLKDSYHNWFVIESFENHYHQFTRDPVFNALSPYEQFLHVIKKATREQKNINNEELEDAEKNQQMSDEEYNSYYDSKIGYYSPCLLGYKLLHELKEKKDNFKYENAYAEPLLGVVRCRSIDSYLKKDSIPEILWNLEYTDRFITAVAKNVH